MSRYDLDPFLTITEGKLIVDFVLDAFVDKLIHVYVNDVLVFKGRYNELVYRIYITGENHCELNFKKVLQLHINGDVLNQRLHSFIQKKKGENNGRNNPLI